MTVLRHADVGEAAAFLGVSPRRVRALIRASRLPAVRKTGGWLIAYADLEAYAAQPRRSGRPSKHAQDAPLAHQD